MYQARDKSIFYSCIIQKANTTLYYIVTKKFFDLLLRTTSFLFLTFKYWYNISGELFSCLKSDSSWNEFEGTGGRTVVIDWAGILSTSTEIFSLKDSHTSCFKLTWGLEIFQRHQSTNWKELQIVKAYININRDFYISDFIDIVLSIYILKMLILSADNICIFFTIQIMPLQIFTCYVMTILICWAISRTTFWVRHFYTLHYYITYTYNSAF